MEDSKNSPFVDLPFEIKLGVVRNLTVQDFRELAATCNACYQLWNDDSIWRYLFKRDFGNVAFKTLEASANAEYKFRNAYIIEYERRKYEEQQEHVHLLDEPRPSRLLENEWMPPMRGNRIPGVIGGAYDMNPFGYDTTLIHPHNSFRPPGPWLYPGNPPDSYTGIPQPGGLMPRHRPVMQYDPDNGLFGMPPPGRGGRRGPPNPFGGGSPFGGSSFPRFL